jgi:hypothetical protein
VARSRGAGVVRVGRLGSDERRNVRGVVTRVLGRRLWVVGVHGRLNSGRVRVRLRIDVRSCVEAAGHAGHLEKSVGSRQGDER